MKTNSKIVREKIRLHILDCVTDKNGNNYNSFEDAKIRLLSEFNRVANYEYNLRRIPNDQERFSDYLWGLPFSFHYTNFEINEYLNNLGINPENKIFNQDKSNKLYHYLIWRELL